jgi:membrane protein required for colicin V production
LTFDLGYSIYDLRFVNHQSKLIGKDKDLNLVILQKSSILVLYSFYMSFLDIVLGSLLVYGLYQGIKNGFFVELASLISLILGIYIAIKFSDFAKGVLSGFVHWNPKTIQIIAFVITFIAVIVAVSLLAKFLTGIADFAQLGWINKLGGGFFRVLKTILILSIFLNLFEKINFNNTFAKKETLDNSLFYRNIQKTAGFIYPSIEKWYEDLKKKETVSTPKKEN